ncbi:MAG: hypothetical protein AMXMBFR74_25070 [Parvibaculum sp.]|jgi:hypothetical protein|uniref:hypothetical protein n=1 Tax=Parvibaculum sp. TaxID=2024848 RepID=UPI0035B7D1B0
MRAPLFVAGKIFTGMETSASLKLPLHAARAEESALAEDFREVFFGAVFFDAPFRAVLRFAIGEVLVRS